MRPREWLLAYTRLPGWLKTLTFIIIFSYTLPPLILILYLPRAPLDLLGKLNLSWIIEWTFIEAFASASIASLIGLPIGIAASYYGDRISRVYRILGLPVFMAPSVSVVLGFRWLAEITGIHAFVKAPLGIIIIHSYYNIPLAAVLTYASIAGTTGELLDYAETIGLRGVKLWRSLLVPSALPGLISAWLLSFIYSFIGLAAPLMVQGAAYRYYTLEAWIYTIFSGFPEYTSLAALLSIGQASLLAFIALLIIKSSESRIRAPLGEIPSKPRGSKPIRIMFSIYAIIILVYLYLPLTGVFLYSFTYSNGISLTAYYRLFHGPLPLPPAASFPRSLINSLVYASITILLVVLLSIPIATSKGIVERMAGLSPLLFSPVTVGLALYLILYHPLSLILGDTFSVILLVSLAHTSAALPLASRAIDQTLARVPRETMQFLLQLGLSSDKLLINLLRISGPGLVSASLLSIVASLGEFGATLVITNPSTWSLGVLTYNLYSAGRFFPVACASASILLALTLIVTALLSRKIKEWI